MMKQPKVYRPLTPEQFEKLTKSEQRVAIAKDVLAELAAEKYIASNGNYIRFFKLDNIWETLDRLAILKEDIQQLLPRMTQCYVCAMGACILSITKYKNKLKFSDVSDRAGNFTIQTDDLIKEVFTPEQLAMIEIMFEGYYTGVISDNIRYSSGDNYSRDRLGASISNEDALKCIEFAHKFGDIENWEMFRMKGIMRHIIENKGEIVPAKM